MSESFQSVPQACDPGCGQSMAVTGRPVRIAFILLERFSLTSFSTALDVLSTGASLVQGADYQLSAWSLGGGPVASDVGVVIDTQPLALGNLHPQILVVVGGHRVHLVADKTLRRTLRRAASERALICGLWNAAFHLADAGLLDDRPCVCHPESLAPIHEYHPHLALATSGHVLAQRVGTCADAGAVLDLMLAALQTCTLGRGDAEMQIKRLHQPERAPVAAPMRRPPRLLEMALGLMEAHIEEPLAMDAIAARVGISRRQLERRFVRYLKAPPVRYYQELRLTRARQLIATSDRSLTEVALATGFVSYSHFHRRFKELFGLPPQAFRDDYDIQRSPHPAAYVGAMPG